MTVRRGRRRACQAGVDVANADAGAGNRRAIAVQDRALNGGVAGFRLRADRAWRNNRNENQGRQEQRWQTSGESVLIGGCLFHFCLLIGSELPLRLTKTVSFAIAAPVET